MISIYPKPYDKSRVNYTYFKPTHYKNRQHLCELIQRYAWSPIIYKNERRISSNFEASFWCVLDIDDGMSISEAADIFQDCRCIIGTTKSHQKLKSGVVADRFRVLVMFEKPVLRLCDYTATMKNVIRRYGADQACKDGARWYAPCIDIVHVFDGDFREDVFEGESIEYEICSYYEMLHVYEKERLRNDTLNVLNNTFYGFKSGERNSRWFAIGVDLFRHGWKINQIRSLIYDRQRDKEKFTESEINRLCEKAQIYGQRIPYKKGKGTKSHR